MEAFPWLDVIFNIQGLSSLLFHPSNKGTESAKVELQRITQYDNQTPKYLLDFFIPDAAQHVLTTTLDFNVSLLISAQNFEFLTLASTADWKTLLSQQILQIQKVSLHLVNNAKLQAFLSSCAQPASGSKQSKEPLALPLLDFCNLFTGLQESYEAMLISTFPEDLAKRILIRDIELFTYQNSPKETMKICIAGRFDNFVYDEAMLKRANQLPFKLKFDKFLVSITYRESLGPLINYHRVVFRNSGLLKFGYFDAKLQRAIPSAFSEATSSTSNKMREIPIKFRYLSSKKAYYLLGMLCDLNTRTMEFPNGLKPHQILKQFAFPDMLQAVAKTLTELSNYSTIKFPAISAEKKPAQEQAAARSHDMDDVWTFDDAEEDMSMEANIQNVWLKRFRFITDDVHIKKTAEKGHFYNFMSVFQLPRKYVLKTDIMDIMGLKFSSDSNSFSITGDFVKIAGLPNAPIIPAKTKISLAGQKLQCFLANVGSLASWRRVLNFKFGLDEEAVSDAMGSFVYSSQMQHGNLAGLTFELDAKNPAKGLLAIPGGNCRVEMELDKTVGVPFLRRTSFSFFLQQFISLSPMQTTMSKASYIRIMFGGIVEAMLKPNGPTKFSRTKSVVFSSFSTFLNLLNIQITDSFSEQAVEGKSLKKSTMNKFLQRLFDVKTTELHTQSMKLQFDGVLVLKSKTKKDTAQVIVDLVLATASIVISRTKNKERTDFRISSKLVCEELEMKGRLLMSRVHSSGYTDLIVITH